MRRKPKTHEKLNVSGAARRRFLRAAGVGAAALAAGGAWGSRFAIAQGAPIRVGFMLPYTGVYTRLGENITQAVKMRIAQAGDRLGGRAVEYVQLDSEASPPKAVDNANRLVKNDKVDFVIGPVHSGVAVGMTKVIKGSDAVMICPNAGANALTRELCAPNIFRTSFSNWQTAFPIGPELVKRGHKNVVTMVPDYTAGKEVVAAFKEGFVPAGGKVVEELWPKFEDLEFQPFLTKIAALKPDAVFVFFGGADAVKFMKDYAAAGLKASVPLFGTGFMAEGTLAAAGEAAEGVVTVLHYADTLDNPANVKFRADFEKHAGRAADVFAVQGYDTGTLMVNAIAQVKGDIGAKAELFKAMEGAVIDSPRGAFTMSKARNPVQDMYLRIVEKGQNRVLGVVHKALADPATGCAA